VNAWGEKEDAYRIVVRRSEEIRLKVLLNLWRVVKNSSLIFQISGLLGYYEASCGNSLPTFRDNISVPSSRVKSPSRKESL
jgi:hypothetical protein